MRIALIAAVAVFAAGAFLLLRRPVGQGPARPGAAPAPIASRDVPASESIFERGEAPVPPAPKTGASVRESAGERAARGGNGSAAEASAPPSAGESAWSVQVFAGDPPAAEKVRARLSG